MLKYLIYLTVNCYVHNCIPRLFSLNKVFINCLQSIEHNPLLSTMRTRRREETTTFNRSFLQWSTLGCRGTGCAVRYVSWHVTSHHTPREAEPLFSSGCLQLHDFELSDLTFIFSIIYMTCNIRFESLCLLVVLYSLLQGPPLKITPVLFPISLSSDDVKNRISFRL